MNKQKMKMGDEIYLYHLSLHIWIDNQIRLAFSFYSIFNYYYFNLLFTLINNINYVLIKIIV